MGLCQAAEINDREESGIKGGEKIKAKEIESLSFQKFDYPSSQKNKDANSAFKDQTANKQS